MTTVSQHMDLIIRKVCVSGEDEDENEVEKVLFPTVMHVAVALGGIEPDGFQEVPLRFCFLPLRETD